MSFHFSARTDNSGLLVTSVWKRTWGSGSTVERTHCSRVNRVSSKAGSAMSSLSNYSSVQARYLNFLGRCCASGQVKEAWRGYGGEVNKDLRAEGASDDAKK